MSKSKNTEIQEALKKLQENANANDIKAYKAKLQAQREAAAVEDMENIRRNWVYGPEDREGKRRSHWDDALENAESMTAKSTEGYNAEWKMATQQMAAMYGKLCLACYGSLEEGIRFMVKQGLIQAGQAIKDYTIEDEPVIKLSSLAYFVDYDDDNKLQIAPIVPLDVPKETLAHLETERQALQNAFKKGIVMWLKDNGYDPHPTEASQFVREGKVLDKATFIALKNDEKVGLEEYLKDTTELSFEARPVPPF